MKIQFHGATGTVTGSAYHVMTRRASVLVDREDGHEDLRALLDRPGDDPARLERRLAQRAMIPVSVGRFHEHHVRALERHRIATLAPSKPHLIITHGEERARKTLARLIRERHGIRADLPELGQVIEV